MIYTYFFDEQLGSGLSPQSCLYFQGFQGPAKLFSSLPFEGLLLINRLLIKKTKCARFSCLWNLNTENENNAEYLDGLVHTCSDKKRTSNLMTK